MAITTTLSPKAMTALGAMALITLCFQTFTSSPPPILTTRLDTIDHQISSLHATINHLVSQPNTKLPSEASWPPVQKSAASDDFTIVAKIAFSFLAIPAWPCAFHVFYTEVGAAVGDRALATGVWVTCVAFVGLWHFGEVREWYGYLLGATWGFYVGILLAAVGSKQDGGSGTKS